MNKNIFFKNFNLNNGIQSHLLNSLELRKDLPKDYVDFILLHNGGEGFIGKEYLVLNKAEELYQINKEYEVSNFDPNIFLIGSSGSEEAIAIDLRNSKSEYILIPYLFEHDAIIKLAENIEELFKRIYEKGYFED